MAIERGGLPRKSKSVGWSVTWLGCQGNRDDAVVVEVASLPFRAKELTYLYILEITAHTTKQ